MSDRFSRLPIEKLLKWILDEEKSGQIFGINKELFFCPENSHPFRIKRYGQLLETPIGLAAGPHTQLAQNIISGWLCGARYMELKTVQTLDEIEVTKPCIDMEDEGYNCEWSQELKIEDSIDEYVNAWILIHLLKHHFGWQGDYDGFIFNMSVGYNLEGIQNPNVQHFFDAMADSSEAIYNKKEKIRQLYPQIDEVKIPAKISDNITLSTMHGCPPDEIEKIGLYLIEEKKLHTTIKLNPTLLGQNDLRGILNDKLGYKVKVPNIAFKHDLKYEDSINLIKNLQASADKHGVEFGLKLTNTLEVKNKRNVLPEDQEMLYMSGRALHPISINVAAKLQNEFNGNLDISFCAGVDCFNIKDTLECGVKPVTVCSDLLKPGGYTRLNQYLEAIKALDLSENNKTENLSRLNEYAQSVLENPLYAASFKKHESIKTLRKLEQFDCIKAPCVNTCAVHQDIPDYLYWAALGEYEKAFDVIQKTNPFPSITGSVCDHLCQSKCTRINYDTPILIREIKRFITETNDNPKKLKPKKKNGLKVAIIGAGPSGLSCAYFLALDGYDVTVYEKKAFAGGMTSDAIPSFRLTDGSIKQDIKRITELGVKIKYNSSIDGKTFAKIREKVDYTFIGNGAQKSKRLRLKNEDADGIWEQLNFLSKVRNGKKINLGSKIAIIGGGNSAMDAARTAKRVAGPDAKVTVLYRRTRAEMPADPDEVAALKFEGIKLLELVAPLKIKIDDDRITELVCQQMELGDIDSSGRRRPIPLKDATFGIKLDSLITAIGQKVVLDFWPEEKFEIDPVTLETNVKNVFAGGDAVRGASTLIKAIADGKKAAEIIIQRSEKNDSVDAHEKIRDFSLSDYQRLQAKRVMGINIPEISQEKRNSFEMVHPLLDESNAKEEASRCLYCDDFCNVCVSVCPNRANVGYELQPVEYEVPLINKTKDGYELKKDFTFKIDQNFQVLNIADFCNECGNCVTFCPTAGKPWQDKPRFYLSAETLENEESGFRLLQDEIVAKFEGKYEFLRLKDKYIEYENDFAVLKISQEDFVINDVKFKNEDITKLNLKNCATMYFLFNALKNHPIGKVNKANP